jgi:hypothetical protein
MILTPFSELKNDTYYYCAGNPCSYITTFKNIKDNWDIKYTDYWQNPKDANVLPYSNTCDRVDIEDMLHYELPNFTTVEDFLAKHPELKV